MCPPPAEPIRPVGAVGSRTYVDGSQFVEPVHRRRRRRGDDDEREGGRHGRDGGQDDDARASSPAGTPLVRDPRAYDDHGRPPDDVDAPGVPHVDATA